MGVLNMTYMIPYLTQTHINGQEKDPLWSSIGVVKARLSYLVFIAFIFQFVQYCFVLYIHVLHCLVCVYWIVTR